MRLSPQDLDRLCAWQEEQEAERFYEPPSIQLSFPRGAARNSVRQKSPPNMA
jgi:hypothetical protein